MQTVFVFAFKNGETIPNQVFGPQDFEQTIKYASLESGAKIDANLLSNGIRTMKVRMPSSDVEVKFKLHAPMDRAHIE